MLKIYTCMRAKSCLTFSATPWTVACQALPSTGFSRQGYWSGLPFPSPGDLPGPEIKPSLPHCKQTLYHLRPETTTIIRDTHTHTHTHTRTHTRTHTHTHTHTRTQKNRLSASQNSYQNKSLRFAYKLLSCLPKSILDVSKSEWP